MPVILLVIGCAIVALGFYRRGLGLRQSLVYASIPICLFLTFSTELLSVFHAVTRLGMVLSWIAFSLAGLIWMLRQRLAEETPSANPERSLVLRWRELAKAEKGLILGASLIAVLVALTALLSAPNTWDAMEYHMPRVVEWINNRGVQLYPTIDMQQLSMSALSEYAILHFQLLAGSDRFANLVQWLAYTGCMVTVSLIARELGGKRLTQILAAVVSGTIETGILGASGAKNDYTLSFWIAVSVYLMLRWRKQQTWLLTLGMGSALALAIFSKGTAYVFLPPLVLFCFLMWDWKRRKAFLLRLPILAVICLAVNGPLWARNYTFSGSPLGLPYFYGVGPNEGRMYGNGHITPTRSLANVIRNVGLNLGTPSPRVNAATTNVLSACIRALGVDPNDYYQLVHSQSGPLPPFNIIWKPSSETQSGNQVHFLLLIAAGLLCAWNWRKFDRDTVLFGCGIAGSFVLYATMLRWSPWNARYQLPVFVLGAVFCAIVLAVVLPRRIGLAIAYVLLVLALPLAVFNGARPLLHRSYSIVTSPRDQTYFFDLHWQYADSFIEAARAATGKNCNSIGIDANQMHFEYPIMALVTEDARQSGQPIRLSYVAVQNPTEAYRPADLPEPCVVICLRCAQAKEERQKFESRFKTLETYGDIVVFSEPLNAVGLANAAASPTP